MIRNLKIKHLPEVYIVDWIDDDYITHTEKFDSKQTAINFKNWLIKEDEESEKQVVSKSDNKQEEGDIIGGGEKEKV